MLSKSGLRNSVLSTQYFFMMEQIGVTLRIALPILAVVGVTRAFYVNRHQLGFIPLVWRRFTWPMLAEMALLAAATLFVIFLLDTYLPALSWGWPNLFGEEVGNIAVAPVLAGSDSPSLVLRLAVPFFLAALLIVLPLLAGAEERIFRKGRHTWREITMYSIFFGLIHLAVGVPLCAGLALIGPGFYYAYKYRRAYLTLRPVLGEEQAQRGGWLVSTTYHALYNTLLVALLLVVSLFSI